MSTTTRPDHSLPEGWSGSIVESSLPADEHQRLALVAVFGFGPVTSTWLVADSLSAFRVASLWPEETTDGQVPALALVEQRTTNGMAERVRSIKERSGLTWEQLARLCGVSRRSVHGWAAGTRVNSLHAEFLAQVEQVLDEVEVSGNPQATRSELLRSFQPPRRPERDVEADRARLLERLGSSSPEGPWRQGDEEEIELIDDLG